MELHQEAADRLASSGRRYTRTRRRLVDILAKAGNPPQALDTRADVTFEPGKGITGSHLTVVGTVEGLDAEAFAKHAEDAKANCPVSRVLNAKINLTASLEG